MLVRARGARGACGLLREHGTVPHVGLWLRHGLGPSPSPSPRELTPSSCALPLPLPLSLPLSLPLPLPFFPLRPPLCMSPPSHPPLSLLASALSFPLDVFFRLFAYYSCVFTTCILSFLLVLLPHTVTPHSHSTIFSY